MNMKIPGEWISFKYRVKYLNWIIGGGYITLFIQIYYRPVGINSQGKRVNNGWGFSYQGLKVGRIYGGEIT